VRIKDNGCYTVVKLHELRADKPRNRLVTVLYNKTNYLLVQKPLPVLQCVHTGNMHS